MSTPPGQPPVPPGPPAGPPYPVPPPPPGQQPLRRRDLVLGAVVAVALTLLLPWLGFALPSGFPLLLAVPATFLAGVVLVVPDRTRAFGLGMLLGFFVSLVVGAGACLALLSSM